VELLVLHHCDGNELLTETDCANRNCNNVYLTFVRKIYSCLKELKWRIF